MEMSKWIGWIVALVAVVVAVGLYISKENLENSLKPTSDTDAAAVSSTGQKAGEPVVTVDPSAAKAEDDTLNEAEAVESTDGFPIEELLSGIEDSKDAAAQSGADEEDETPADAAAKGIAAMFEGEQGEQMAEYAANIQTNMLYGDLLNDLQLPSDVEEQVRTILQDSMKTMTKQALQYMQSKGEGREDMTDWQKDLEKETRDKLAEVLNAEELAYYDEYEETKESRAIQKSYEMQMSMQAPQVTEENRKLTTEILAEEFQVLQDEQGKANPGNPAAQASRQAEVFQRTRERIIDTMDPDQYAQVDRFLTQQEKMIAMFMNKAAGQEVRDSETQ